MWIKYDPRNLARIYVRDRQGKHWPVPYADLRQPAIALWELTEARKRLQQNGLANLTERDLFANILQQRRLVKEAMSQSQQRRRKERIPLALGTASTGAEPVKTLQHQNELQPFPVEIWAPE